MGQRKGKLERTVPENGPWHDDPIEVLRDLVPRLSFFGSFSCMRKSESVIEHNEEREGVRKKTNERSISRHLPAGHSERRLCSREFQSSRRYCRTESEHGSVSDSRDDVKRISSQNAPVNRGVSSFSEPAKTRRISIDTTEGLRKGTYCSRSMLSRPRS